MLQALGVNFEDGKFGLGRSLFSKTPTLFERDGLKFETELSKASKVYESFDTIQTISTPQYHPYLAWDTKLTDTSELKCYASFANVEYDAVFLDEVSFSLPDDIANDLIFQVTFKTLLTQKLKRDIKIFANQTYVGSWRVEAKERQPVFREVRIPAELVKDAKLLVHFESGDINPIDSLNGIGIMSMNLKKATD